MNESPRDGKVSESPGPDDWQRGFLAAVRQFMERHGEPVEIRPDAEYAWDEVSVYGWRDAKASGHVYPYEGEGCAWRLDPEAELVSRTYSVFVDTFHGNDDEVGLNMGPAACACGAYTGVTLRYVGSLGDILPRLLGIKEQ